MLDSVGADWHDDELRQVIDLLEGRRGGTQGDLADEIGRTREGVRKKIAWLRDTPAGQATRARLGRSRAVERIDDRLARRVRESRAADRLRGVLVALKAGISPISLRQRIESTLELLEGEVPR